MEGLSLDMAERLRARALEGHVLKLGRHQDMVESKSPYGHDQHRRTAKSNFSVLPLGASSTTRSSRQRQAHGESSLGRRYRRLLAAQPIESSQLGGSTSPSMEITVAQRMLSSGTGDRKSVV